MQQKCQDMGALVRPPGFGPSIPWQHPALEKRKNHSECFVGVKMLLLFTHLFFVFAKNISGKVLLSSFVKKIKISASSLVSSASALCAGKMGMLCATKSLVVGG